MHVFLFAAVCEPGKLTERVLSDLAVVFLRKYRLLQEKYLTNKRTGDKISEVSFYRRTFVRGTKTCFEEIMKNAWRRFT